MAADKTCIQAGVDHILCQVLKDLHFGSGKVALRKGQAVTMVIGHTSTYWIYSVGASPELLYTFNKESDVLRHIAIQQV